MDELSGLLSVSIVGGNIYLSAETCNRYLRDAETVALLPHDDGLLILPLMRSSAGGILLKTRNLRGDRVIHAQDFFRNYGLDDGPAEVQLDVRWLTERAGLLVCDIPKIAGHTAN